MESKYADEKTVEQLFVKRKQHSPRSRRKKLTVYQRPYSKDNHYKNTALWNHIEGKIPHTSFLIKVFLPILL
jgi:hypothetical protein